MAKATNRDGLTYGEVLTLGIADRVEELVAEFAGHPKKGPFPFEYEIEDVRERCPKVDERAARADFYGLRRGKNGRELLALWQARALWNENRPLTVDDIVPGLTHDPEARELEMRLGLEDEAFRYSSRCEPEERWEGEYAGYESQDAFIRDLTSRRRAELANALKAYYGEAWNSPKVAEWVQSRIVAKHGNALRGYCSCLYTIKGKLAQREAAQHTPQELVMQEA